MKDYNVIVITSFSREGNFIEKEVTPFPKGRVFREVARQLLKEFSLEGDEMIGESWCENAVSAGFSPSGEKIEIVAR